VSIREVHAGRPGLRRDHASLYSKTGLFAWASGLSRFGTYSPVRKVFLIGRTLAIAWRANPRHGSERSLDVLMEQVLEGGAAPFTCENLVPLSELVLRDEPGWDPHEALAELMVIDCGADALRAVRSRLRASGLSLRYAELHDVSTAFVNSHLIPAVRSFDPARGEGKEGAWLSTVLYRFALQHALIAHRLEFNLDVLFEIRDSAPIPEEQLAIKQWNRTLARVPSALARLASPQRHAVELYFGLRGREHAIKEVALALQTNPYFARLALTQGLLALAAELGVGGMFSPDELRFARALFVDGERPADLARRLGVGRSEVTARMSHMAAKIRASLRERTMPIPKPTAIEKQEKEPTMPGLTQEMKENFWTDLNARSLRVERDSIGGVRLLGEHTRSPMPVEEARALLRDRADEMEEHIDQLEDSVAAIFAPDGPREDLTDEDREWISTLNRAVRDSSLGFQTLVARFRKQALELKLDGPDVLGEEEFRLRVQGGLSGIVSALELGIPRSERRSGRAELLLQFGETEEQARFGWHKDHYEPVGLLSLFRHRFGLVGGFAGDSLDLLARLTVQGLQQGWMALPRFDLESLRREDGIIALNWRRGVLPESDG